MERSWSERVYCPACSLGDRSSTKITSASNSGQGCNPLLSVLPPRALDRALYIVTQAVTAHCLRGGSSSPAAAQLHHQVVQGQLRIPAMGTFTVSIPRKVLPVVEAALWPWQPLELR